MPDTSELGRTPGAPASDLGSSDNRLSLDLNNPAFDFVQEWEDGQNYTVKLRVTQVSPGEFEVLSGSEAEGEDGDVPEYRRGAMGMAGESDNPQMPPNESKRSRNPAIAKMLTREGY